MSETTYPVNYKLITSKSIPNKQNKYTQKMYSGRKKHRRCPSGTRRNKNNKKCTANPKPLIVKNNTAPSDAIIGRAIMTGLQEGIPAGITPQEETQTVRYILVQQKSFSPAINKRLITMTASPNVKDIFGCDPISSNYLYNNMPKSSIPKVNIGTSQKPICVNYTTKKAQAVLLHNLARSSSLVCSNIVAPKQIRSNCWFNVLFMIFFISDKGRKFFRFFRQLMIEGKLANGKKITPRLHKAFYLLNMAIEASYNLTNSSKATDLATLMNTNTIIEMIHSSIPRQSRISKRGVNIPAIGKSGNPLRYYEGIFSYLAVKPLRIEKIRDDQMQNNFKQESVQARIDKSSHIPDIIVFIIHDNGEDGPGKSGRLTGKQLEYTLNFNSKYITYKLDSVTIRDTRGNHFCALLTCNGKEYGFDGLSFSRLSLLNWRKLINKSTNWGFEGSNYGNKNPVLWNFRNGYQLLFYYRIN